MTIYHKINKIFPRDILKPEGFKTALGSLLVATLGINILSLALPVMTLQVYDRILPNPGTGTLPVLIAGVCLAIFLEMALRLSRAYVIGRAGAAYEHRISCEAMNKVLYAELSRIGHYGIGEHLNRMGSISKLRDFYNGYALTVWLELALVPLFFGIIIYIAGPLALVPAGILLLFTIVSIYRGWSLKAALQNRENSDDRRFNFLIESLEGVHTIKAFALEKFFERRYEKLEEESTFSNYRVTQEMSGTFNAGAIFSHIMVSAVICLGAVMVLNGQLSTGGLIATLLLSGRIMQPVQKALALWARYQDYQIARNHLESLFATPQKTIIAPKTNIIPVAMGSFEMCNVSFGFQNANDKTILNDISLELKRGEAIFINGGHGAGKTTLLDIMAGIYAPQSGNILVDQQDILAFEPLQLIKHIGYIRSQAIMFRGTIRDNITCFGQTPERQAREVTALTGVDAEIAKLPSGFDTFLSGTDTDTIPKGLKQRIAITRVLANKPKIILFDNADSSLDLNGYKMIYSLLARLKKKVSMVLVSEDRNIMGLADRHYLLENGILSETSPYVQSNNIHPYKELRL
jgi:ATP-binding cassette, subfamily C, bacterial LapB